MQVEPAAVPVDQVGDPDGEHDHREQREESLPAEHPVHVLYTDYSKAKGQSLINSVNILVDLIFK